MNPRSDKPEEKQNNSTAKVTLYLRNQSGVGSEYSIHQFTPEQYSAVSVPKKTISPSVVQELIHQLYMPNWPARREALLIQKRIRDQSPSRQKIISIDFESCIFNETYFNLLKKADHKNNLHQASLALFSRVSTDIFSNSFEHQIVIMNGSIGAQSLDLDELHAHEMAVENGVSVDDTSSLNLLADITSKFQKLITHKTFTYNDYQLGESLGESVIDKSGVMMLYAQIHQAASQYFELSVDFDYYTKSKFQAECLTNFFRNNIYLIPANLKLNIYFFQGNSFALSGALEASASNLIDFDYSQNSKVMFQTRKKLADQEITLQYSLPEKTFQATEVAMIDQFDGQAFLLNQKLELSGSPQLKDSSASDEEESSEDLKSQLTPMGWLV